MFSVLLGRPYPLSLYSSFRILSRPPNPVAAAGRAHQQKRRPSQGEEMDGEKEYMLSSFI